MADELQLVAEAQTGQEAVNVAQSFVNSRIHNAGRHKRLVLAL